MIFEKYGDFLEKIPDFIAKPLGKCVLCNGFWIFALFFTGWAFCGSWPRESGAYLEFAIVLFLGAGVNYVWTEIIGQIINE